MSSLSIKKVMATLAVLFLLSNCASNRNKDEEPKTSSPTIQIVPEPVNDDNNAKKEDELKQKSSTQLKDQLNYKKNVDSANEEESPLVKKLRREYHLNLISKYINKIQVEYNDPNLDYFITWAASRLNKPKKSIEITLQVALSETPYSEVARWTMIDIFQDYEEIIDTHLRKVGK